MTWHEVSLKQICDVDWGNTKLTKSSYVADGEFLAVSAAGADGLIDHYEHEANVPVLSAIGAQCGRMFYPGARFTAIKNTITLTPKDNMADGKFLYYLFTSVELPQRGAGQPFISKGDIESFKVFIPESLEEQREIVEKLDTSFAELDLLEANLQLSDEKANQLMQSLLNSAYTFTEDDIDQYQLIRLGDLCDTVSGLWTGKKPPYEKATVIRNTNFTKDCKLDLSDVAILDVETKQLKTRKLIPGDLIVEKSGGGPKQAVGRVVLFSEPTGTYSLSNFTSALRVKNVDFTLPKYLQRYLYFQYVSGVTEAMQSNSTGIRNLNIHQFLDILVPIPPAEKQSKIVEKLDSAFAEIELFKVQYKNKRIHATALRQSLLINAFTYEGAVA